MASRAGQPAAPQFSLPKLSAEEQFVQKKQGEHIQGDVRVLNSLNVEAPFTDVRDAVTRLLPFHLFNAVDASEADLDDTPDHAGADLMSNRHDAWQELCLSKANQLRQRTDKHAETIAALEQQLADEALSGRRPVDAYAIARLQQEDLRRKVAAEKTALQAFIVPAVQAAPLGVAAAAGGGGSKQQGGGMMVNQAGALAGAQMQGAQQQLQLQLQLQRQAAMAAGLQPQQLLQQQQLALLQLQQQQQQQQQYALLQHQMQQQQILQFQQQQLLLQQQQQAAAAKKQ